MDRKMQQRRIQSYKDIISMLDTLNDIEPEELSVDQQTYSISIKHNEVIVRSFLDTLNDIAAVGRDFKHSIVLMKVMLEGRIHTLENSDSLSTY